MKIGVIVLGDIESDSSLLIMRNEEVKAIIKPIYDLMEKEYYDGHMDKVLENYFHTDAVVVQKGRGAQYGKKSITEGFDMLTEEYGKVKLARSNENFSGCDTCLCASYDVNVDSPKKGKQSAKVFHVWKKEDGKWKIYHEEFDILTK